MKIALVTTGTRGDAQPMILLARELEARGHQTVLGLPPNVVGLGRLAGVRTETLGPDTQVVLESEEGRRWLAAGDVRTFMKELEAITDREYETIVTDLRAVCEGADLVVAGLLMQDHAAVLCEAWDIPMVVMHAFPWEPNATYTHLLAPQREMPRWLNRLTHALVGRVWWHSNKAGTNQLRAQMGLGRARASTQHRMARVGTPVIQGFDPVLTPGLEAEYGDRRPVVGFLTPDDALRATWGETALPEALLEWLAQGEPPVFFGFGSMPVLDPAATVAMIIQVSRRLGVRAVVNAGWAGLAALDASDTDVFVVGAVNHDALLPHCRAAVHHGGAGTTAASLAAGLPTVVCSVFADQPFWGAQLARRGLGATVRFAELDADRLHAALDTALSPAVVARAAAVGRQLCQRGSGTGRAADVVEAELRRWSTAETTMTTKPSTASQDPTTAVAR